MTLPVGAYVREGVAYTAEGAMIVSASGTAALTGGTITGGTVSGQVAGVRLSLAVCNIPFVMAPTGTMANNGAVTLGTALATIYTGGVWMFFPAGAVAAGVPASASWLWTVMSSTTVGTVFNSTYTTGIPTLGTATAYVTTGPGAFTGVVAETTGPQWTLTGGSLGTRGKLYSGHVTRGNAIAGGKTIKIKFGASIVHTIDIAASTWAAGRGYVGNQGSAALQSMGTLDNTNVATSTAPIYTTINSAADVTISRTLTNATATNVMVLESCEDEYVYVA